MVHTPEVDRWLTQVQRHLGEIAHAVELVMQDPITARDPMLKAGEATLEWLSRDPGPWADVTELMRKPARSCVDFAVTAAEMHRRALDGEKVDTAPLYAIGERIKVELGELGEAGKRHGLG